MIVINFYGFARVETTEPGPHEPVNDHIFGPGVIGSKVKFTSGEKRRSRSKKNKRIM